MNHLQKLSSIIVVTNHKKQIICAQKFVDSLPRKPFLSVVAQFDLPESTKKIIRDPVKGITDMLLHNKICTNLIEANGGQIIKELGDAVLVKFESVPAACRCALNVIHNLKKYGKGICTKVTITTGSIEEISTRCEPDVYGGPVSLCNRMARHAKSDSILIEESRYPEVVQWLPKNKAKFHKPAIKDCCEFGDLKLRKINLQ